MHQFFILQVVLVGVGLLRDSNGAWVQGFSRLIGSSSVLLAELWALRDEIAMALNLNIDKLIINVDASEVINLFSKLNLFTT
ncbi:hypothetical protein CFP56_014057 [Quercus suber]|uniref:RNase H type-1 domain-containing protein n=1 Tax=Quercus suber TaxID=58331 RepID=A0AAW0KT08_QUESU